jgi:hypothetical protein
MPRADCQRRQRSVFGAHECVFQENNRGIAWQLFALHRFGGYPAHETGERAIWRSGHLLARGLR